MEIWDLYDENRNLTKESCIRGDKIPDNYYHLVVHVWIRNDKGEYLVSQRAATRPTYPLFWECVGGSVVKGEDSLQGAIREVKEEVGIDLSGKQGKLIFTKMRKDFHDLMDVWLFKYDGEVDLKKATTDEVKEVRWMKKEEIKALFDSHQLVPTLEYFLSLEYE